MQFGIRLSGPAGWSCQLGGGETCADPQLASVPAATSLQLHPAATTCVGLGKVPKTHREFSVGTGIKDDPFSAFMDEGTPLLALQEVSKSAGKRARAGTYLIIFVASICVFHLGLDCGLPSIGASVVPPPCCLSGQISGYPSIRIHALRCIAVRQRSAVPRSRPSVRCTRCSNSVPLPRHLHVERQECRSRGQHHRLRATARSGTTTTVLTSRCSRRRPSFQRWQHARWPSRKLMARGRLCLLATGYNAVPADARRRVAACVELPSWHAE